MLNWIAQRLGLKDAYERGRSDARFAGTSMWDNVYDGQGIPYVPGLLTTRNMWMFGWLHERFTLFQYTREAPEDSLDLMARRHVFGDSLAEYRRRRAFHEAERTGLTVDAREIVPGPNLRVVPVMTEAQAYEWINSHTYAESTNHIIHALRELGIVEPNPGELDADEIAAVKRFVEQD